MNCSALEAASPSDSPGFCRKASRSRLLLRFPTGCARRDAGAAQELARCPVTRSVPLAARVTRRGMAECGGLTVTNRVAVQRAYGLGGTRGASGEEKASEKSLRPFWRGLKIFLPNVFKDFVKNRDKLSRKSRDKRVIFCRVEFTSFSIWVKTEMNPKACKVSVYPVCSLCCFKINL